jgi:hypothetical protein
MSQLILEVNGQEQIIIEDAQEFIDCLVELDEEKTSNLLVQEQEAETVEEAEVMAESLHFLNEAILGYLDYQLEEGLISEISHIKTKAIFESGEAVAYDISIIESDDDEYDEDTDREEEEIVAEAMSEIEAEASKSEASKSEASKSDKISITEAIQDLIGQLSYVEEVVYSKKIRHGVLKKLLECPAGWRSHGGRCIKMGATEVRRRMRASIKANKTKKKEFKNSAFRNRLMKLRNKSLKLRKSRGLK